MCQVAKTCGQAAAGAGSASVSINAPPAATNWPADDCRELLSRSARYLVLELTERELTEPELVFTDRLFDEFVAPWE